MELYMSLDIEDIGSAVFEEMCADYLAYCPFLSKYTLLDHYGVSSDEHKLVMLCNEIGKSPKKVYFTIKIDNVKDVKES
jgi:hypothetical protein